MEQYQAGDVLKHGPKQETAHSNFTFHIQEQQKQDKLLTLKLSQTGQSRRGSAPQSGMVWELHFTCRKSVPMSRSSARCHCTLQYTQTPLTGIKMSLAGKQRETAAAKPHCQAREVALAVLQSLKLQEESQCML